MADGHVLHHFLFAEGERPQRLRQELDVHRSHCHLTSSRAEKQPSNPYHVADVVQIECGIQVLSKEIVLEVDLNASSLVRNVGEGRLSMRTPANDASGDTNGFSFAFVIS